MRFLSALSVLLIYAVLMVIYSACESKLRGALPATVVIPGRPRGEPGIHLSQRSCGSMDFRVRGFAAPRNDNLPAIPRRPDRGPAPARAKTAAIVATAVESG